MILGIVLHTAIRYVDVNREPTDPNAVHEFFGWLASFIHNFRMPIFMLIAGFFAALLFYDRSPKKMIINRFKRIVLPFGVFVFLLWPFVLVSYTYTSQQFGIERPPERIHTFTILFENPAKLIPKVTMHLWFLYYLIMFSAVSFGLGKLMQQLPTVTSKISHVFNYVIQKPFLKLAVFTLITFGILMVMGRYWVATSTSFVPDGGTFSFYLFFYLVGWVLFKSKHLLSSFMKHDWLFTLVGLAILTAYFLVDKTDLANPLQALIKSLTCWLFIFGFTGLFLRYFSNHSPFMRYVSDSAYWVYLLHQPITVFIPGLISGLALSAFFKFTIVVTVTTFLCFLSYHFLVRSTFIGRFLNGRRYSKKFSDIKKSVESPKPVTSPAYN